MDFLICSESVNSSKPGHPSGPGRPGEVWGRVPREGNSFGKQKADSFFSFLVTQRGRIERQSK